MPGVHVQPYRAERASAADGVVRWVVVDEDFEPHIEASAYLVGLRAAGRAFNTEKTYAGRIALYLSYCQGGHGMDWTRPGLVQLMVMMRWLVDEPVAPRSRRPGAAARYRSEATANAIMGTVGEFLSWCCLQGWGACDGGQHADPAEVSTLSAAGLRSGRGRPAPDGDGPHDQVPGRDPAYEWLSEDEIAVLLDMTRHARDAFLIHLLAETEAINDLTAALHALKMMKDANRAQSAGGDGKDSANTSASI